MRRLFCLLLLALAACSEEKPAGDQYEWKVIESDRKAAMLGVWGTSSTDVYAVGGDARDGNGPTVMHWDGTAWNQLDPGLTNTDLWSVFAFPNGPVFIGGAQGTILRYQNGAFERMTTPGTAVVFGIWGTSPTDVWAVGGNFSMSGFAWHYDGTAWTALDGLPAEIVDSGTIWKVSGRGPNDVWMSATDGITLRYDGTTLTRADIELDGSLFSVSGNSGRMITVGGDFTGVIYEDSGSGWQSVLPPGAPILSGVIATENEAFAVGHTGAVLRRGDDGWVVEQNVGTTENLHAAYIDPEGGVWAVGGDFNAQPTKDGVLISRSKKQ